MEITGGFIPDIYMPSEVLGIICVWVDTILAEKIG